MFGPKLARGNRVKRNRYNISAFIHFYILKNYYVTNFLLALFIAEAESCH